MGNLSHLTEKLSSVQTELANGRQLAASREVDIDAILEGKFGKLSKRVEQALKQIADENRALQQEAFSNAVRTAVLTVNQNEQGLLNSLSRISNDSVQNKRDINTEIGKVSNRVEVQSLADRFVELEAKVANLPTQFPIPKDVDLSGLAKDIQTVRNAINDINIPEMPKTIDISGQLEGIEKRMGERVTEFNVIRDPMSGTIERIVVTEGVV